MSQWQACHPPLLRDHPQISFLQPQGKAAQGHYHRALSQGSQESQALGRLQASPQAHLNPASAPGQGWHLPDHPPAPHLLVILLL